MKIHDVKIVLDRELYYVGEKLTGKLVVKTNRANWKEEGEYILYIQKICKYWYIRRMLH